MTTKVSLLREFGLLRMAAVLVVSLPLLALPVLGVVWLWQDGHFLFWLLALTAAGATGALLHWLARQWEARKPNPPTTIANPHWPAAADAPWQAIDELARTVTVADYSLAEGGQLWDLGKQTLTRVAQHYHPDREQPLLEMTLPHALLIIERASHELRLLISDQVPFSHQLTLGDITRARQWKATLERYENIYRLGHAVVDPAGALFREFRREVSSRIIGYGSDKLQTWLLQEYVRKVGFYAIELYSGNLLLTDEAPTARISHDSQQALREADATQAALASEPLHFLVLGRTNAGKSSLINALFGELKSVADIVPDTTVQLQPFRLERDGKTEALIYDSPGFDSDLLHSRELRKAVDAADLILLVSPANAADRHEERQLLQQIRQWQSQQKQRRPAPVLLVLTHVDRLRPVREWQPPYPLDPPASAKGQSILEALHNACEQLNVPQEDCVPVCLAENRQYNVEDALWASIIARQDEAERARYLRCLAQRRKEENWSLLWKQLRNSGRLLKPILPR